MRSAVGLVVACCARAAFAQPAPGDDAATAPQEPAAPPVTRPPAPPPPKIAQPAPPPKPAYPEAVTDRPLVSWAGITTFDVSMDFPTYTRTTTDAMGNATTGRTPIGERRELDLLLAHSFGPVELTARVAGQYAHALVDLEPAPFQSVGIGLDVEAGQSNIRYDHTLGASYNYKGCVVPHRFAIVAGASAYLEDLALTPANQAETAGHIISLATGAVAEMQLLPGLALTLGGSVSAPISNTTTLEPHTAYTGRTQLIFVIHRWDFYGQFALFDLGETTRPFLAFGVAHRWGG